MEGREEIIRRWFAMWLEGKDQGIREIFAEDCVYVESWGPIYHGVQAVEHWFSEWNTRGKVVTWEIRQFFHQGDQTVVEWYFRTRWRTDGPRILTESPSSDGRRMERLGR